jgi:hypothetical protein
VVVPRLLWRGANGNQQAQSSKEKDTKAASDSAGASIRLWASIHTANSASTHRPPNVFCSLEVLDDVAQQNSDGSAYVIQSKSALGANPVSDRAISLWKTLANWARAISSGVIGADKTQFELYVSKPVGGDTVDALSLAQSKDQASKAILLAKKTLWGKAPAYKEKKELTAELLGHTEAFFGLDNDSLLALVVNTKLVCGSGSPQSDIENIIASHPVSASKIKDIADHVCGIVKRDVDRLLEKKLPAVLSRDEFHAAYTAYCRRIDRDTILKSSAKRPSEEESKTRLPDTFVQQLDLIELSYEEKLSAVSDYLMASSDRTAWEKSGEVDRDSFDELDESLSRYWTNRLRAMRAEHGSKPECSQGQLLYSQRMDYRVPLQAMETPQHFIPGCYHQLADILNLGWHPNYQALLKKVA